MITKPRIAHFAGPNATIQNTPPLVTGNKARAKYGLPLMSDKFGVEHKFDVLRPQRLAVPVKVYVKQYSAHPLEADAANLYADPDGFIDPDGRFHTERKGPQDDPVYEIELMPEDGLYPLPYMARQADGSPWVEECAYPGAPIEKARQPFYPDGARGFEETDRLGVGENGLGNQISDQADMDFFRILPPAGYTQGLPADQRTDMGEGDIDPEIRGKDFFPYKPYHIGAAPPRQILADATNKVQRILNQGEYLGAVWTQGSPRIEETIYWFNLLLDTTVPICGNAAQRPNGQISNDGPKNIVDSISYITSRVWQDEDGRNRAGMVLVQEQQIFSARDVQKADARPGGYVATGGHGGIIGATGHDGEPVLTYLPTARHTFNSSVNTTRIPNEVTGIRGIDGRAKTIMVPVKDANGDLLGSAIPKVRIVKDGSFLSDEGEVDPEREVDLIAMFKDNLEHAPLSGFVVEGLSPYGIMTSMARHQCMMRAVHLGMPVVRVGRGNNEGFTPVRDRLIGGRNLTSTKARLLLMACIMRFGCLPPAKDPDNPTEAEKQATREKLSLYQEVFDTH